MARNANDFPFNHYKYSANPDTSKRPEFLYLLERGILDKSERPLPSLLRIVAHLLARIEELETQVEELKCV